MVSFSLFFSFINLLGIIDEENRSTLINLYSLLICWNNFELNEENGSRKLWLWKMTWLICSFLSSEISFLFERLNINCDLFLESKKSNIVLFSPIFSVLLLNILKSIIPLMIVYLFILNYLCLNFHLDCLFALLLIHFLILVHFL